MEEKGKSFRRKAGSYMYSGRQDHRPTLSVNLRLDHDIFLSDQTIRNPLHIILMVARSIVRLMAEHYVIPSPLEKLKRARSGKSGAT
jgi:hypothetical protein